MKTQEKQKNKDGKLMQENKIISKMKQNKRNNTNSISSNYSSFNHTSNSKYKLNI